MDVIVDPADFADITDEDLEAAGKTVAEHQGAARVRRTRRPTGAKRRIVFRFQTSPIEIRGDGRVASIVLGRNELVDDGGRVVAKDTGEREELPAQLVVRAVGYRGVPTPGLPFDERTGTIPHTDGRVEGSRNEYVVGWIKRGPSGRHRQQQEGFAGHRRHAARGSEGAELPTSATIMPRSWRSGCGAAAEMVTDDHWKLIDAHERVGGRAAAGPG